MERINNYKVDLYPDEKTRITRYFKSFEKAKNWLKKKILQKGCSGYLLSDWTCYGWCVMDGAL